MEKQRAKWLEMLKANPRATGVLIGCAAVIVLLVMLCISVIMRTNIQSDYTQARNEISEELYTQLYMLCQTFDQVTVPGQDLENVVIPMMEDYYLAAQTLSDVMGNAFGRKYIVLSQENSSALNNAFDAYEAAFRGGKTTEEAQQAMQECMNMIRTLLESRFRDGIVLAA